METEFVTKSNRELLAERLGEDIVRRGLRPGDRYVTAAQAAQRLGVSRMSVDRAMNLLVQKRLLVRQRGRGTFVGPVARCRPATDATHVHLLVFGEGEPALNCPAHTVILAGLRRAIPSAIVHTHMLPFPDALHYVQELVSSEPATNRSGWILSLSPREVQEWFARRGVPAIVLGTAFPGVPLADIQSDQSEAGAELLRLAHRMDAGHYVFVNRQNWRQGDVAAMNGALRELGVLRLPPNRFEVCNIPSRADGSRRIIETVMRRCMDDEDGGKPVFLCRATGIARLALGVADRLGVGVPDDLGIVYQRPWTDDSPVFAPCVSESSAPEEGFVLAGRLLEQALSSDTGKPESVRMPLQCMFPEP